MATIYGPDAYRVRVYVFVPGDRPGLFHDKLHYDVVCNRSDLGRELAAIYQDLPANHFAIVCDSLSNSTIPVGYAGPSVELGPVQSEEREGVDSSPQGLARDETSPEEYPGTREREGSRAVAYEREYLRVSTQFHP